MKTILVNLWGVMLKADVLVSMLVCIFSFGGGAEMLYRDSFAAGYILTTVGWSAMFYAFYCVFCHANNLDY